MHSLIVLHGVRIGLNEASQRYWKHYFVKSIGSQEDAVKYRLPIYLTSAAVGE